MVLTLIHVFNVFKDNTFFLYHTYFRVLLIFKFNILCLNLAVECASLFDVGNVKSGFQAVFKRRDHHLRR